MTLDDALRLLLEDVVRRIVRDEVRAALTRPASEDVTGIDDVDELRERAAERAAAMKRARSESMTRAKKQPKKGAS